METGGKKFGGVAGYAYVINSCIGAGFLAIPWAYQNVGWLLALCMQVLFLLVGWLLSDQLLEITSRMESIKEYEEQGGVVKTVTVRTALKVGFGFESLPSNNLIDFPEPTISEARQYDLSEIVKILMGHWWSIVYLTCLSLFLAGTLAAYVNIFGTGLGTHAPLLTSTHCDYTGEVTSVCRWQYRVYVGVFFALMVYFTSIEFHEQLWMQLVMTVMRVVVMTGIIVTCVVSLLDNSNIDGGGKTIGGHPPIAVYSTIGKTFPILLFAGIYQIQYPGVLSAIRKDRILLRGILLEVTMTLIFFYCLMGLVTAFAIENVPSNVSLSFENYTGGYSRDARPWWATGISYLIILFPTIDVISIFPIVAHGISDNVMSLLYSSDREALRTTHRLIYYSLRVGCIIPSFAYAFFALKLGSIASNSGLFCFYLTFFMIPMLHIAGKYIVQKPSVYDISHNPLVSDM